VRPEGKTFAESADRLDEIVDIFAPSRNRPASSCCGARPTCFSHRRFMAGAATNPDPDVFAYAAATVKTCIDVTSGSGRELRAVGRPRRL
jgi:xylose isomerase